MIVRCLRSIQPANWFDMSDREAVQMQGPNTTPLESGPRLPNSIFGAIVLAAVAQCLFSFPHLPERLASHFGASGLPNGWMTKQAFFIVYAVMIGLAALVEFYPGRFISRSPARINLPNKEYWLAPERRTATFTYFEKYVAWYGCAFPLTIVLAMGLAIQANLNPPPHLPTGPIAAAIFGFVLFNLVSLILLFRRFSKIG
jgi:uncharacterized membrane protein